jgi:hypothetical protein
MDDRRHEWSDELLTTRDVSRWLQVAEITVRKWRLSGRGPLFVRCGTSIRYRPDDLNNWVKQRTAASTSTPLPGSGDGQ